jgi:hypothetical protein
LPAIWWCDEEIALDNTIIDSLQAPFFWSITVIYPRYDNWCVSLQIWNDRSNGLSRYSGFSAPSAAFLTLRGRPVCLPPNGKNARLRWGKYCKKGVWSEPISEYKSRHNFICWYICIKLIIYTFALNKTYFTLFIKPTSEFQIN